MTSTDTGKTPSGSNAPAPARAWRNGLAITIFLAIAALAAGADLLTKHQAFASLLGEANVQAQIQAIAESPDVDPALLKDPAYTREVLKGVHPAKPLCPGVDLTLSTNPGVVFGFNAIPTWIVNLITLGMIVVVTLFFLTTPSKDYWMQVALALILGGAIGNLYDRVFCQVVLPGLAPIQHHVRDFIDCSQMGYVWIFNLADVWLVAGVLMIVLHMLRSEWAERAAKKKAA